MLYSSIALLFTTSCSEFSTHTSVSSLSPFGFDAMTPNSSENNLPWSQEFVPLGAVGLFSACSPEYQDHVNSVVAKANLVYMDFLQSDEGRGFSGQVHHSHIGSFNISGLTFDHSLYLALKLKLISCQRQIYN